MSGGTVIRLVGAAADEKTGDEVAPFSHVRMAEALLFAAAEPLDEATLAARLPESADVPAVLAQLAADYAERGVGLVHTGAGWSFRTATDIAPLLRREAVERRKLSRVALETLAIIAYHQPVTRAEIEAIRGVSVARGTLELLLDTGWIRLRGRRKAPGRPVTFGTTPTFLDHFGLEAVSDLPGVAELKAAGLLDGRLPLDVTVPTPLDDAALAADEDPLEEGTALDLLTPLDPRAD